MLILGGFSQSVIAGAGLFKDFVIINKSDGSGNQYYYTYSGDPVPNQPFGGRDLGTVDRTVGNLFLNGGEANTYNDNGDIVTSARMYYTVYPAGSRPSNVVFTPVNLLRTTAPIPNSGNNRQWATTDAGVNLAAVAGFVGSYILEVYFDADYLTPSGNTIRVYDGNGGANYRATFTVTNNAPPVASQTSWTSGAGTSNWFDSRNWSNGVPNADIDATIPVITTGRYPELTNEPEVAQVHTLQIEGTGPTSRAQLSLTAGQLRLYGNFINPAGGFTSSGGIFIMAGLNQTIDAGLFSNVRVEGGGLKVISTRIDVSGYLDMIDGILETRTNDPSTFGIDLRSTANLSPESIISYVRGVIRTDRVMQQGKTEGFGGIGVIVTPYGGNPGNTFVTRTTSVGFNNVGGKRGINRSFEFRPSNNENLNVSMLFQYQDIDVLASTVEANLKLFVNLPNTQNFWDRGYATRNTGANTLTQNGINELRTFTLGDGAVPLPVALTSFSAGRQGNDAVLTWTTAQEENNANFDVQVSTDGESFRTLTSIAPQSPNSTTGRTYKYNDKEVGKSGMRYYRLRQLDLNGKETFYGPQAVDFGDAAVAFSAAPNPFISEVTFTAQTSVAGGAVLRLTDMNGRTVREQTLKVAKGVSNLAVANLDGLAGGMYFVQLTLPDGQVQRTKVLKQ